MIRQRSSKSPSLTFLSAGPYTQKRFPFVLFTACSQGNREQPTHYLKQYKNAGKHFRVRGLRFMNHQYTHKSWLQRTIQSRQTNWGCIVSHNNTGLLAHVRICVYALNVCFGTFVILSCSFSYCLISLHRIKHSCIIAFTHNKTLLLVS